MGKSPAFQFYTGDWMKDTNLRICSPAARGVLADLLCLMWESEKRGVLRANSRAISIKKLSKSIAGCTPKLIKELVDNRVVRIARKDGALYSKRQVRDELKRRHKSQNGQKGGKQNPSKPPSKSKAKRGSSSSSSSSSSIKTKSKTPLPPKGENRFIAECGIEFPENLRTEEFLTTWREWETDRKRRGKKLTVGGVERQFKRLAREGPNRAIQIVDTSIESGWTRLVYDGVKNGNSGPSTNQKNTFADQQSRFGETIED